DSVVTVTDGARIPDFDKDDIIEIVQNHGNGTFTGILLNDRQNPGLVHSEHVRRVRTNSVQGMTSPLDSPANFRIDRKESTVLPGNEWVTDIT
ncbi:hypothetical protein OSTOST_02012, partial [Ostertagia ostertagi]